MNRSLKAIMTLSAASMLIAIVALAVTSEPLAAAKSCEYTSQPACGCSSTATNPATGATCNLSSWSCGSSGNVCTQTCSYTC
jgi:hypothetical protein